MSLPSIHRSVLVAIALLLAAGQSQAGCLGHPSQGTPQSLSFGIVEAAADAAPRTVLAERVTTGWDSPGFKCLKPTRTGSLGVFTTPSVLGDGIYDTNVPGVGIRIQFHHSGQGDLVVPYSSHIPWIFDGKLSNARFTVQLIKTGPILEGGSLTRGTLARAGYDGQAQVWVDLLDARVEPQRPTCAFASRRLVFPIGNVEGGTLAVAGSSHWATQQLVATGCTQATQILLTFAGTADETDASLFKLTGNGAATGVAVELRSDDPDVQAIPNSAAPLILSAAQEGRNYGFRARYRTTGKPLAPGSANASITVNVAYR
ncbi:fimbrial protein [Luteibacter sp. E-22]|uniref:fimbrial protein n=1 Tax=Luteibacter sp. E-22 TaxID=3404050 RepID=UPI003CF04FBE